MYVVVIKDLETGEMIFGRVLSNQEETEDYIASKLAVDYSREAIHCWDLAGVPMRHISKDGEVY